MAQMLKVTASGGNRKLGKGVATTYRPVGDTCPQDCKMLEKGCYAKRSFVGIHQRASRDNDHSLDKARNALFIRHHVSGDVFVNDVLDVEYVQMLIDWHTANPLVNGWMYTHRISAWVDAGFTADKIPSNLEVIASVDTEAERVYSIEHGFKYARIEVDADKSLAKNEVLCPFDKKKDAGAYADDIKVTCRDCQLCFADKHAERSIVFMYQKASKKQVKVDLTIGMEKGKVA